MLARQLSLSPRLLNLEPMLVPHAQVTKAQGQPEISRVRNLDLILRVWREDKDGKAKASRASLFGLHGSVRASHEDKTR